MLSRPPASLAASMSMRPALGQRRRLGQDLGHVASGIIEVSPSEQIR